MNTKSLNQGFRPTFLHFFVLCWAAYQRLDRVERKNAALAVLVALCYSCGAIYVIADMALSHRQESPRIHYRMAMATPANLTLSIPDRAVTPSAKKRDTAPRSVTEIVPSDTWAYIDRYKAASIRSMRKTGVPASITLAQGIIESNSGKSFLATKANNHFGIKCQSRHCRKGHCINRADDSHKDFFLKFDSAEKGFEFHGLFLSQGRYKKLHKYGRDYRAWAYGLKRVGYATDPNYPVALIGVVEKFGLNKFD